MRVYLTALGCKLNESEIEAWARQFASAGHEIVDDARAADWCILNTCTITHVAARKSRQLARQLARANPRARLALTGCHVSVAPDEVKNLPQVALVAPNAEKEGLVACISNQSSVTSDQSASNTWAEHCPHPRTRAFVKVQDGCNLACAYCIIPRARGAERSRPRAEIVAEVKGLVDAGYKEIVLTGVQISAYANGALRDLVAAILGETGAPRLRLSSLAPWRLDEALLGLWRDPRLCRHLHLSLQSGCDAVLQRMHRPYTVAQFARAVELAREHIPAVGITTDVIVGFPGETDAEFEQSVRAVEALQFARVHVFPYSPRAGTPAAALPQLAESVKAARARQMQAVAEARPRAFAQRFVGQTLQVLWEMCEGGKGAGEQEGAGENSPSHHCTSALLRYWSGYTDNYIRVVAASDGALHNQIIPTRLVDVTTEGARGVVDIGHVG